MKKWIAFTLCCALLLSLTACAQNTPSESTEEECMHEYVVSETAGIFADKQKISTCSLCGESEVETVAPASKSLKILSIGNSFGHNSVDKVYQIAKNAGAEEIVVGWMGIGGSDLDMHATNILTGSASYEFGKNTNGVWDMRKGYTYLQGLQEEQWDIIIMNQAGYLSGKAENFGSGLKIVVEYIREHMPAGCKLYYNMVWSFDNECTFQKAIFERDYQSDCTIMYNCIADVCENVVLPKGYFDGFIPNATVVQNMRSSWAEPYVTADTFHMSANLGCYGVGLGTLAAVTDINIGAVTYFPAGGNLAEQMKAIADEAVENALKSPFSVTKSQYTER